MGTREWRIPPCLPEDSRHTCKHTYKRSWKQITFCQQMYKTCASHFSENLHIHDILYSWNSLNIRQVVWLSFYVYGNREVIWMDQSHTTYFCQGETKIPSLFPFLVLSTLVRAANFVRSFLFARSCFKHFAYIILLNPHKGPLKEGGLLS